MDLKNLGDGELDLSLQKYIRFENETLVAILDHISEVFLRELHLKMGFTSVFKYLVEHHGYSKAAAQARIDAASFTGEFPQIRPYLINKELNITQLGFVAKAVREKDRVEVVESETKLKILNAIRGKSGSETEVIVLKLLDIAPILFEKQRNQSDGSLRVEICLSPEQLELCETLKSKMSHTHPNPTYADIFEYAILAALKMPKTQHRKSKSKNRRYVAKHVEAELCKQQACCQWRDPLTGKMCESRFKLEIDHIIPIWAGGTSELENLQRLCQVHNRFKYGIEMGQLHAFERPSPH